MADYIYLLETRLSPAQQRAIGLVRAIARAHDLTVFLTGGAVRDLTGGASVRDLDLTLQGDVFSLRQALEDAGAVFQGEHTAARRLFLTFPGSVRVEIASAMRVTYPSVNKPEYEYSNMTDALRSRDFTANAMAISLNEGSYGLLMDPLNGVADIENRELRLVSNYGFIEDPSRLIRATRLMSRLGWQMEERTRQRYDIAKDENYISSLGPWSRGYELEEIFHEEDPLRILRALEAEGWSANLLPALQSSKANAPGLAELAERQGQLQSQGVFAQSAALSFPLLTAKLSPQEVTSLKRTLVLPGFITDVEALEGRVRDFGTQVAGKEAATPSAAWKLLHGSEPDLVLALFSTSKSASVQARLKTFLNDSPNARQRIPYALLQEMRITPDLPGYNELLDTLFFELMDGGLATPEEMKAFLEPYSPPAPPPPINLRRAKAKKEARPSRAKAKKATEPDAMPPTVAQQEEAVGIATGLMEAGDLTGPDRGPEPTPDVPLAGKVAPEIIAVAPETHAEVAEAASIPASDETEKKAPPAKKEPSKPVASDKKKSAPVKAAVAPSVPATTHAVEEVIAEPEAAVKSSPEKSATLPVSKQSDTKKLSAKVPAKQAVPAKTSVNEVASPAKKSAAPAKTVPPAKAAGKKSAPQKLVPAKKAVPAKKTVIAQKTPAKKTAPSKKTAAAKKNVATKTSPSPGKVAPSAKKATPPRKGTGSAGKKSAPIGKTSAPAKKSTVAKKATGKSAVKKNAGRKR